MRKLQQQQKLKLWSAIIGLFITEIASVMTEGIITVGIIPIASVITVGIIKISVHSNIEECVRSTYAMFVTCFAYRIGQI